MKRAQWWTPLLLSMAAPALAQDGSGTVRIGASLRAGPALEYPRVATTVSHDTLRVHGCTQDWAWCDVSWSGKRGWLPGGAIDFGTQGEGVAPAVPTVGFALDRYWDTHYRGQPWARERARYRPLESASTAAGPAQIPAPLQRQLAPQWRAPPPPPASASEAVSASPQWTPPGERMHQIPPPDALNPRYNKELAKELQRQDDDRRQREAMGLTPVPPPASAPSASPSWPPTPATIQWVEQHPPKPSSPPPPPPPP
ncbi:SH3 domain-containing protein, partial [Xanthomonas sp. NCPPB 1128]|uniref:SH3 domain-containing protein n=1 Tax=Xanthomonas sp. NCPPB 1128 TaxID=1775876 RepID=UPI000A770220